MMKNINQAQDSAKKILGSISDRLSIASAGVDTLNAVCAAADLISPEILSESLWFVRTVLKEQVDNLSDDASKLMKIAEGGSMMQIKEKAPATPARVTSAETQNHIEDTTETGKKQDPGKAYEAAKAAYREKYGKEPITGWKENKG